MRPLLLILICIIGTTTSSLNAQTLGPDTGTPLLALPALDNAALLQNELRARHPDRAPRFAETRDVDVRPTEQGIWVDNGDGTSTWLMRISSPGAHSLNLGFTEYWMPAGGELYLRGGSKENGELLGPFTPADNEVHEQLWTPIVSGDEITIVVRLPNPERSNLRLRLTRVNHDFLNFRSKAISGSCNVDVVCGAADGLPIVDLYRDIIRSVAVISTGGGTFCTGFLVNNTRNDETPYFMTANHCGINNGNAPSLVTYWNFENSTCRAPGSPASGGNGDGVLGLNNTGAIWRASNPASDMTIVELDDPVNPDAGVFFAGWDNSYDVPLDTVIGIHHPSTDEKRISFTFQQTFFTNGFNGPADNTGTHLEIPDWDIGTTEPGSSGSPVFDKFHRVRGQLHGGGAACGNDQYDTYGAFARSWEGGGTSSSRLRDWLDPDDTGVTSIDGFDTSVGVNANPVTQSVCGSMAGNYSLGLGGGFTGPVDLFIEDLPGALSANFSSDPAAPGSTVSLTVTPGTGIVGDFTFTVTASDGTNTIFTTLSLSVAAGIPLSVSQVMPGDAAVNVQLTPTLSWMEEPGASGYEYELAADAGFSNVVATGMVSTSGYEVTSGLDQGTTYFWRVRATNECGTGAWSPTRSFTTLVLSCGPSLASVNVPVAINAAGTPEVSSTLQIANGPTIAAMEVSVEITHTYVGDLSIDLIDPDGISVTLADRIGRTDSGFGCSEDNLMLTFSDLAAADYATLEATCNVGGSFAAAGTFRPLQPLSAFNGQNPTGEWTLRINDNANDDGGQLVNWSISLCGSGATLPVELTGFSARVEGCEVLLDWSVGREENFSHFVLEGSADGRDFRLLTKMDGSGATAYRHRLQDVKSDNFFRLKMVDLDQSVAYSGVVTATTDCGETSIVALYPNPLSTGNELTVQFNRPLEKGVSVRILGTDGRQVADYATGGGEATCVVPTENLPAGTYFLRIVTSGEAMTRKFLVSVR